MRNDAVLSVRIPKKMKKDLESLVAEISAEFEYEISLSQLVAKIIEDHLDQEKRKLTHSD